jgi:iron complex transport system permease protein
VQLASIVFWTFGDFGRAGWKEFYILLFFSVPVIIYFLLKRWTFLCLDSGDEIATSLGVNVNRTRVIGMLLASLVTSVAISFFGIIAFVGLVVPHIVRRIIGSNERFVIPSSLLFGGFFLLLADTFSRTIISPMVLPVGILTSFLGAPVFIFLIIRRREIW